MNDDTVCAVIQLKDLTNPLEDPNCKTGYGVRAAVNETKALEHDLPPSFRRGGGGRKRSNFLFRKANSFALIVIIT
jgi:hypothetical protein